MNLINKSAHKIRKALENQVEEIATTFAEKSTKNCCLAFLYEPEVPKCLNDNKLK
ncbi:cyclic lactone autoinducer peptide [Listeria sp. FSL L7-1582]|uniref:cyclic lactone autoinducer peptide n=1 Tax=Listeria portnoyi TaxID=2713504 RepID=UPI00164DF11A|nr:cyclic lactone autoinducer peptide [Listeria portnoyi]MBC6309046.1 cyclic lactone autoinducer peptide [Listeria portnoyi]